MDQGPDSKRPRFASSGSGTSWPSGPQGPLPNPGPPPPSPSTGGHHPPHLNPYQSTHPFSRSSDSAPPPPLSAPAPLSQQQPPPPPHYEERRHHDSDHYPPMSDHRPSHHPSPAHGSPYPSYPRETLVKREPDELPQLRRPHSTGNAPETGLVGAVSIPHHSAPPQVHPDDRRHMSFDGGPPALPAVAASHQPPHPPHSHPPPPPPAPGPGHGMYAPRPAYPPSSTVPMQTQPYEHTIYSPHEPMGYPVSFTSTAKRKAQRASQACDNCRQLKAKCDELKPCKNCKDKGLECKYRDPVPKQQDKVAADILDSLLLLRDELSNHRHDIDVRFNSIEKALLKLDPTANLDARPADDVNHAAPAPSQLIENSGHSPEDTFMGDDPPPFSGDRLHDEEVKRRLRDMNYDEERETVPGQMVPPGEPAIPAAHTTLATFLLTWPSIKEKAEPLLHKEGIKYPQDYPISDEHKRGTIRLFGRGEGHERAAGSAREVYGEYTGITTDPHDDRSSDVSSSPQADVHCGQTGGLSPGGAVTLTGSPLRPNGGLDFNDQLVWKYVQSYLDNIQNMHPLIYPKDLKAMVQDFLDRIPTSKSTKYSAIADFVNAEPRSEAIGSKRKRSPAAEVAPPFNAPLKPGRPYRSVGSALVLLVLALGKICLRKDRLPDVVPETEAPLHQSPQLRNGHPGSPAHASPPSYSSHSQSSTLSSPKPDDRSLPNRRFSQSGQPATPVKPPSLKRNIDSIPGLEYFATATDIIGNCVGTNTLKYAWVNILASLYQSQLARPTVALEHIAYAGRTLLAVMRPHMARYEDLKLSRVVPETKRDNQLLIAFWTCLQLESDILAELPLPASGILAYEDKMAYPNLSYMSMDGLCSEVEATNYWAQLWLRKTLNSIHRTLYDTSKDRPVVVSELEAELAPERLFFKQPSVMFNEYDPPSNELLRARLRAKHAGARVITSRPFIRMILDFNYRQNLGADGKAYGHLNTLHESLRLIPHIGPDATEIPRGVVEFAKRGISALIESTMAFHGLQDKRFIVTNVYGTAHAQWGNLLVLEAVSRDPVLAPYLSLDELRRLFRRTIEFFEVVQQKGSTLMHDMNILKGLEKDLLARIHNSEYVGTFGASPHTATPGSHYGPHIADTPGSDKQLGSPPGPLPNAYPYEPRHLGRP